MKTKIWKKHLGIRSAGKVSCGANNRCELLLFSWILFQDLIGNVLPVVGDMPLDEWGVCGDSVSLEDLATQSLGDAYKGSVYVRVFIGVSARAYINIYVCTMFQKKIGTTCLSTVQLHGQVIYGYTFLVNTPFVLYYSLFYLCSKDNSSNLTKFMKNIEWDIF